MPVKIGYEIELLSPHDTDTFSRQLRDINIRVNERGVEGQPYSRWRLHTDGSLRPTVNDHRGHELVSPVLPIEVGLEKLQDIFQWMPRHNHYTNSTCGFHVGVSLDADKMRRFDPLKLALIFDAKEVLDNFGRLENRFCRPIREYLNNQITANMGYFTNDEEDIIAQLRRILPQDKYCATNISKLQSPYGAYVEFRGMGGTRYERRFDDIKETIEYYARVMEASADPDQEKRLYTRELNRLVRSIKNKVNRRIEADRVRREEEERQVAERQRMREAQREALRQRDLNAAQRNIILRDRQRDEARGVAGRATADRRGVLVQNPNPNPPARNRNANRVFTVGQPFQWERAPNVNYGDVNNVDWYNATVVNLEEDIQRIHDYEDAPIPVEPVVQPAIRQVRRNGYNDDF